MTHSALVKLRRRLELADRTMLQGAVLRLVWFRRSTRTSVLRLAERDETLLLYDVPRERFAMVRSADEPQCRQCGCTESDACPGGCGWAEPGLCTACFDAAYFPPRQG